jgi:outer membrane cobalamin receptor
VSRSRTAALVFFIAALCTPPIFAEERLSGTVLDPSGRVVPRALVRALDAAGAAAATAFADESGRFELIVPSAAGCRLQITLAGFQPATARCESGRPLRVVLALAPVEEALVVTATRTDAPASQVGASATVLTAVELQRRDVPLLADLLRSTPGAMVIRSGGPGALASLFVRGGESDYNKVLLDGVPLNEPGGSFYLNNLTTENLERVEILRGAYSSLFGSDAMASVVQLFTKRGDPSSPKPRITAQVDGGTYETWRATAGVSGASAAVDYGLGVSRFDSDNRAPNSRFENTTLSANVGLSLADATTLRFIGRGELEHVGTPGPTAFGRPDRDAFFERRDGVASLGLDRRNDRVRQRLGYSIAVSHQQSTNLVADSPYRARFGGREALFESSDFLNDSRTRLRRHHASYQADFRVAAGSSAGSHLLTVLADWDGERAGLRDLLSGTRTRNSRDGLGIAAEHQALWPRLFVTVGARVQHNESFGTAAVPRVAVAYVARESSGAFGQTLVRASAGKGIKEPTMLESFSASPFFLGNPDLKPERSRAVDAGIEQRLASDRAKLELTYFHNRFADIISLVTTNPSTFEARYANVGVTRARGLEAGVQAAPLPGLAVRGGYTWLDSKLVESASPDDVVFGLGQQAFRRPRHSGYAGVTLTWGRTVLDVNGLFVGTFVDSDFGLFDPPLTENPGHQTWDARLAFRFTPRLTGTLAADNVTNRDYSEPFGYQPLLRVVRAGLRVAF